MTAQLRDGDHLGTPLVEVEPPLAHLLERRAHAALERRRPRLAQVGEHVAEEAGIAVDHFLDPLDRSVIIGLLVKADPQFGEVRADHLVSLFGAADMRTEVADARDRPQLLRGADGDPVHGLDRRPRLLNEVHQEVGFAKIGKELILERRIADAGKEQAAGDDAEMAEMAAEEIPPLEEEISRLEKEVQFGLVPPDPTDSRNTIVEIRAGAGGDEAALFVGDLYRMYTHFATAQGWSHELMESNAAEMGGFREVIFALNGEEVYKLMKFESGVHRVQRVPATEASGRIHTSTVTVAVLPEAEEVDVEIDPNDLDVDVYRSSGPGGQSVNTTDSAVRLTHKPTGLVVTCQDEKSQHKNKAKAMKVLRSRLLDLRIAEEQAKYAAERKAQVGTGERNERIRTYNFPQNRVSDHRIELTLHSLPQFMEGEIIEMSQSLWQHDLEEKLNALKL